MIGLIQAISIADVQNHSRTLPCDPAKSRTHSGMGAALLSTPDILLNILRNLIQHTSLPVSCKIRLLPTQSDTLHLAARILRTGIRNLTVHCRTRDMRPRERAIWDRLHDVVQLGKQRGIPVTCNGDGDGWTNWDQIRAETGKQALASSSLIIGADSVMLARAAERNPSVFLPEGPRCNITEIVPKFINICEYIDNPWGNTKFLLAQFRPSAAPISSLTKSEKKAAQEAVTRSKSLVEVAEQLNVQLGKGAELLSEISKVIARSKPSNVFDERAEAVAEGRAVDEAT